MSNWRHLRKRMLHVQRWLILTRFFVSVLGYGVTLATLCSSAACSSGAVTSNTATAGSGGASVVSTVATGGTTAVVTSTTPAPSWTELYDGYFGPGTAGNCVSCHSSQTPTFDSAATMCAALKTQGWIVTGTAGLEYLISWFGLGGAMPQNGGAAPANAVNDIMAWENARAVCP